MEWRAQDISHLNVFNLHLKVTLSSQKQNQEFREEYLLEIRTSLRANIFQKLKIEYFDTLLCSYLPNFQ